MVRYYGGMRQCPKRFTVIANVAKAALQELKDQMRKNSMNQHSAMDALDRWNGSHAAENQVHQMHLYEKVV